MRAEEVVGDGVVWSALVPLPERPYKSSFSGPDVTFSDAERLIKQRRAPELTVPKRSGTRLPETANFLCLRSVHGMSVSLIVLPA